jgi:D-alanyl-lipoteichoic acid acyltransferase DltB (MBOAT superfamily)
LTVAHVLRERPPDAPRSDLDARIVSAMSFVSFTFAAFFLIVVAGRVVLDRPRMREVWLAFLLVASLAFYAWNVPWHVLVLIAIAVAGYVGGRVAGRPVTGTASRIAPAIAITVGLGLLGLFKYWDYVAGTIAGFGTAAGAGAPARTPLGLLLPLGISFYTFEMISYVVDVRRGRIPPARRFDRLLLFLAFFPHLVAGPIVRAGDFLYQIERRRRLNVRVAAEGIYLIARGLFLKVVVADNLAAVVDLHWGIAAQPGANASLGLLVMVLFAFQILCDFDGYSTIARGTAYLLGFRLPINFDSPYVACTFREFWRRWHITLSRWLRDYLYLPLGGNRVPRWRLYVNLLIVMTLGGLWHGAADTFLVWGALHGAALAIERALGLHTLDERGSPVTRALWWMVVQTTVLVAWVFFRSPNVGMAMALLTNVVTGSYGALGDRIRLSWLAFLIAVPIAEHVTSARRDRLGARPAPMWQAAWGAALLYAVCTVYGPSKTFIYFRF